MRALLAGRAAVRIRLSKSVKMLKVIYCLNVLAAVGGMSIPEEIMFAILKNGVPVCSGVPVGNNGPYIATAAHCVYGVSKEGMLLRRADKPEQFESVKRVIVHPYYMPPSVDYDIALLRRGSQNETESFGLMKVPLGSDDELMALSWDLKEVKSKPKEVNATLEDRKSCRAKLANHILVSTRMVCANIKRTEYIVDGSPLIVRKKVPKGTVEGTVENFAKGILGFGSYYADNGGKDTVPKVFTNIANSEIYSFIERYTD